jgi:hypothetical protein
MVLLHLEIVNALGALDERMALAQYNRFQDGIEKYRRRRRWFESGSSYREVCGGSSTV